MLRKRAVALALSLLASPIVLALGLGTLKTQSPLNQPFDGRIEILGASATDFDTMTVKLADAKQFERAGVPREAVLLALKFNIVSDDAGPDYIRISTRDPVREPFLNFLLELNWAKGRMVREYTVLLDPPRYDPNRRAQATTPVRPYAAPSPRPAAAPAAALPGPGAPPTGVAGGEFTVQEADTLWSLASRHRPDPSVSVQRMMVALLRANPEAFISGNMNLVRRGAVMRLSTQEELNALDQGSAVAEVQQQNQRWEELRQGAASAPAAEPLNPPAAEAAPGASAAAAEARLELVAPEAEGATDQGTAAPAPGSAQAAASGPALAEEELTTSEQEKSELRAKLTEADQIIDLLQRQVQIKDEELAALQTRLAAAGEPATATPDTAGETAAAPPEERILPAPWSPPADVAQPETGATPPPALPAAAPSEQTKPAPAVGHAEPPPTPSFLDRIVPPHIQRSVPGGALTILGVLGTLAALLLVWAARAVGRGRERPIAPAARGARVAGAAAPASAPVVPAPLPAVEAPTEEVDQFQRTLEASAEQLAGETREDPLEEVNVYLAYERFDQAEELVKKVIEQYPDEHKYKLRLLEIYYSANNKRAYEDAARSLYAAVGEHHPLWESAVAMWNEMSPERPLFSPEREHEATPVAAAAAAAAAGTAAAFVDITGDTSPGAATLGMAPGGESALETTKIGLTNERAAAAGLDFDLGTGADTADEGFLDLTAAVETQPAADLIDLTASTDLDSALGDEGASYSDLFDISAEESTPGTGLTLDYTEPAGATPDLLDITKTGGQALDTTGELLDVTTPAADGTSPPLPEAGALPATDTVLDFDLSDTVAPALESETVPLDEAAAAEDTLDFDIGGLGVTVGEHEAGAGELDLTLQSDVAPASEPVLDLELDDEAAAELDLSLTHPPAGMAESGAPPTLDIDSESEIEFDLALQDTTDFDSLAIEDTLELPKADGAVNLAEGEDESLEDLTRSMEASLAGFDLEDVATDETSLDLALGALDADAVELDFSLDEAGDLDELDTLSLDTSDLGLDGAGTGDELAISSDSDEADTKLNLAKAYIELGDHDGARSILDEVVRAGSEAQQEEARRLLAQLT